MGLKLVHTNLNPILKSSVSDPKLVLLEGGKIDVTLWPGDVQPIPLPKVIDRTMLCAKCGESDEYAWININAIHCYSCSLTSIQKHVPKT